MVRRKVSEEFKREAVHPLPGRALRSYVPREGSRSGGPVRPGRRAIWMCMRRVCGAGCMQQGARACRLSAAMEGFRPMMKRCGGFAETS